MREVRRSNCSLETSDYEDSKDSPENLRVGQVSNMGSEERQHRIRVLIADDHVFARQAVAGMLTDNGMEVVGQAKTGENAIALAQSQRPEIALVNVEMLGIGIMKTIDGLYESSPESRIIVLTVHDSPGLRRAIFARGVNAYLMTAISCEELVAAIRSVSEGEKRILLSSQAQTLDEADEAVRRPTERELEILRSVARGMSNAQIASLLHLKEGTIKRHLYNTYRKLKVVSRSEATKKTLVEGWLTADDIAYFDE